MRVFRSTYKDKATGASKKTAKWYVEFTDHREVNRRIAGFKDKGQTQELGRKLELLVMYRSNGSYPDVELQRWFESMPPTLVQKLATLGLLDNRWVSATRPLGDHLDDFREALQAKGNTNRHVELVISRARKVIVGCGFTYWSHIQASKVMTHLHDLRQDTTNNDGQIKRGISNQTFNFYLQAIKQFCRWMVQDRRASESPVGHLHRMNVRTDRRHDRRAMSADELQLLLTTTETGPVRRGITGRQRAMVYRVAVETGLRAGELRNLKRSSFDLDGQPPTVTVEAAYSKHRREDVLPLRGDTVTILARFLQAATPQEKAFPMPSRQHLAKIFRADLEAAGLVYTDGAGRVADFHSLRHTFITNLAKGGIHPKIAQALARHSTITLTMDRYSHTQRDEHAAALDALPSLQSGKGATSRETGVIQAATCDRSENSAGSAAVECRSVQEPAATRSAGSNGRPKRKSSKDNGFDEEAVRCNDKEPVWRGGRAAEGAGLENRYAPRVHRGFESHPLRFLQENPRKLLRINGLRGFLFY